MQEHYTIQTTPQGLEIRISAKRTWQFWVSFVWSVLGIILGLVNI